ncbi:unnamed protein product [Pieris macdunnoughi]|uniref:Uncharacterized protein n=1 Tax=Pieris macdunnoughi TaxID=345717 RepID=A0A821PRJ0_9NEOP|nr:unnamed protein product [Pieris macdunnoughi]
MQVIQQQEEGKGHRSRQGLMLRFSPVALSAAQDVVAVTNPKNQQTMEKKRERPEDSVLTTGETKRVKPNRPRSVGGTSASYAAASYKANELLCCVAVMTETFSDMTQELADNPPENLGKASSMAGRS